MFSCALIYRRLFLHASHHGEVYFRGDAGGAIHLGFALKSVLSQRDVYRGRVP